MFNPNKATILFIEKDDKKLSDGFWIGVNQALEAIYDGTGKRYESFSEYRSNHASALLFAYYFNPAHRNNGNIGEINEHRLINCYQWSSLHSSSTNYDERIRGMCLISTKTDTREVKKSAESVIFGLRLTLLSMRNQGLLLLPMEFRLPTGNKWLYNSSCLDSFFPPIAKFFLSFHNDTPEEMKPYDNPIMQHYLKKSSGTRNRHSWFSSLAVSLIAICSVNTASKISLRDLVRISYLNQRRRHNNNALPTLYDNENFSTTPIPIDSILGAIAYEYGNEVRFSVDQFQSLLTSYRNGKRHKASWIARRINANNAGDRRSLELPLGGSEKWAKNRPTKHVGSGSPVYLAGHIRLEKAREAIMPSDVHEMAEDQLYEHCINLNTLYFSPDHIQLTLKHVPWRVNEGAITYWVNVIEIYRKTKLKKLQTSDEIVRLIGNFFIYLFFYLPRWFDLHQNTKLSYPKNIDELDPIIYGSSPIEPDYPSPQTFISFMQDRAEARSIGNSTLYSYLYKVYQLFEWITGSGKKYIVNCSNPQLLFDKEDLPLTTSRRGTTKNIFPKKLFKTAVSYAYAVLEFKAHIQQKMEKGECTYDDLGISRRIIKTADFGFTPKAYHLGREYDVVEIPSHFLKLRSLEYKDGRTTDTIHLGPTIHNVIALETGLRGRHIQWLDDTTFDPQSEDQALKRAIYPLSVKTDKKGHSWTPFVSARVISLLRNLSSWKNSIADPAFYVKVNYAHKTTHYGKFNSVFASNTAHSLGPITDDNYRSSWDMLCLGLQMFLSKHAIDDIVLVKYLPVGAKNWKAKYSEEELLTRGKEDERWADGLFTPVNLRSYITSHGARASVVSANISVLPADVIGKYITGQTERVVYYYAKTTVEDINDLTELQTTNQKQYQTSFTTIGTDARNANDAVMLHCEKVNRDFAGSVNNKYQLDQVIESFGMISLDSLNDANKSNPTGIDLIRNSSSAEIAYNDSHICPFGNTCPKEIVTQYGEMRLCGICAYSIKSVDHLPAIAAAKHAALEKLDGLTKMLEKACERQSTDDVIFDLERRRDNQALNALGWELTAEILHRKLPDIKKGVTEGLYTSFQPEFVSNYLSKVHVDNDEANFLICRLKECIEYPSLESESVKTRFELAKRKLLVATGDLSALLDAAPSLDPAAELYSLISSLKNVKQMSNAEILSLLRSNAQDFLPNLNHTASLLGRTE